MVPSLCSPTRKGRLRLSSFPGHDCSKTHPVDQIEDQAHGDAELLKVQVSVIVHVRQVPHLGQLVFGELTVFKDCGGLIAVEVGAAVGERGEDLPITLDLPLLDLLVGHNISGQFEVERGLSIEVQSGLV